MRYRLPELLNKAIKAEKFKSRYDFLKRLNAEGLPLARSTIDRWIDKRGRLYYFENRASEVLCTLLGVDAGELFENESRDKWPKRRKRPRKKPKNRKNH